MLPKITEVHKFVRFSRGAIPVIMLPSHTSPPFVPTIAMSPQYFLHNGYLVGIQLNQIIFQMFSSFISCIYINLFVCILSKSFIGKYTLKRTKWYLLKNKNLEQHSPRYPMLKACFKPHSPVENRPPPPGKKNLNWPFY